MEKDNMRTLTRKAQPVRMANYVFILWGDNFEEEVATIFATELRRTGVGVKMVGLTGLQATGVHGLVIAADLTLGQSLPLADKAICVIAPCSAVTLQRSEDDPRLPQFFQRVLANQAHLVVSHNSVIKQTSLKTLVTSTTKVTIYSESESLIDLACATAISLSAHMASSFR